MSRLSAFSRTGRVQLGPGSDLVELQSADGARHTAVVFHPEFRSHNAINAALGVVLGFLESPWVPGLAELEAYDLTESTFVYPTGHTWSIAECIRTLSDLGEAGGVRAGVELLAEAGQIIVEAAETGESAGVYSHGGLTPWRVMLNAEGRVQLIGHALPQVEILTFHEHPDRVPREDAFRYCPPERMESRRENFSSDLFGLALIAFEVMTGKPVYDGLVNDIRAKAARAETSRRVHQFREFLPDSVRELLTTALRPDVRDRFVSGADFQDAVARALRDPAVTGVGLRDVMQRVSRHQPRARQELDPARTSMLSKDALRAMLDEAEPPPKTAAAAPPSSTPVARAPVGSTGGSANPPAISRAAPPPVREVAVRVQEDLSAAAPASAPPAEDVSPVAMALRSGTRPNPRALASGGATVGAAAPPEAPSGPPAMGVARTPPRRLAEPGAAGGPPPVPPGLSTATPRVAAVAGALEPQVTSSGDRARDLLARVKSSGDAVVRTPESAAEALERVLRSSGSRTARTSAPMAPPPPALDAAPALVEAPAPASASGAVDSAPPAPASMPPAFSAPPPPPASVASSGERPGAGGPPPATPPVAPEPAPPPASPTPTPEVASMAPPAAPAAPVPRAPLRFTTVVDDRDDDADDDDNRTMAFPRRAPPAAAPPSAAPVVAPPVAPPVAPVAAPPPVVAPPVAAPVAAARRGLSRSPDPLRAAPRGAPVWWRWVRPGLPIQKRQAAGDTTLGDLAGRLVGQAIPLRVGPDGRVLGWWRLGGADGALPVDTRLDSLGNEPELHLHFVPGRVVSFDVEVVAATTIQLCLPLATAVPVASLIDSLATMLDLPAGEWRLSLDGRLLDPFHILEDVAPTAGWFALPLGPVAPIGSAGARLLLKRASG